MNQLNYYSPLSIQVSTSMQNHATLTANWRQQRLRQVRIQSVNFSQNSKLRSSFNRFAPTRRLQSPFNVNNTNDNMKHHLISKTHTYSRYGRHTERYSYLEDTKFSKNNHYYINSPLSLSFQTQHKQLVERYHDTENNIGNAYEKAEAVAAATQARREREFSKLAGREECTRKRYRQAKAQVEAEAKASHYHQLRIQMESLAQARRDAAQASRQLAVRHATVARQSTRDADASKIESALAAHERRRRASTSSRVRVSETTLGFHSTRYHDAETHCRVVRAGEADALPDARLVAPQVEQAAEERMKSQEDERMMRKREAEKRWSAAVAQRRAEQSAQETLNELRRLEVHEARERSARSAWLARGASRGGPHGMGVWDTDEMMRERHLTSEFERHFAVPPVNAVRVVQKTQ